MGSVRVVLDMPWAQESGARHAEGATLIMPVDEYRRWRDVGYFHRPLLRVVMPGVGPLPYGPVERRFTYQHTYTCGGRLLAVYRRPGSTERAVGALPGASVPEPRVPYARVLGPAQPPSGGCGQRRVPKVR